MLNGLCAAAGARIYLHLGSAPAPLQKQPKKSGRSSNFAPNFRSCSPSAFRALFRGCRRCRASVPRCPEFPDAAASPCREDVARSFLFAYLTSRVLLPGRARVASRLSGRSFRSRGASGCARGRFASGRGTPVPSGVSRGGAGPERGRPRRGAEGPPFHLKRSFPFKGRGRRRAAPRRRRPAGGAAGPRLAPPAAGGGRGLGDGAPPPSARGLSRPRRTAFVPPADGQRGPAVAAAAPCPTPVPHRRSGRDRGAAPRGGVGGAGRAGLGAPSSLRPSGRHLRAQRGRPLRAPRRAGTALFRCSRAEPPRP